MYLRRLLFVTWLLIFLCAGLSATESAAQSAPSSSPTPAAGTAFGEAIEVNLINLEVFVTDKDGQPVEDLKQDQFLLFEDGRPMEITNFYAVDSTAPAPLSADEPAMPRSETAPDQTSRPRYMVAFFDNLHIMPDGRRRITEGLAEFLKQAGPEWDGRVMIATPKGGGFEVLHPFGSPLDIHEALTQLDRLPAEGIEVTSNRRTARQGIRDIWELYDSASGLAAALIGTPCSEGQFQMEAVIRSYAIASKARIAVVLSSLAKLTSSLAALPGHKMVVYAGNGLEFTPGGDLYHYLTEVCPELTSSVSRPSLFQSLSQRFDELTTHANANQVTFYTLDAGGMRRPSTAGIEEDSLRFAPSQVNDQVRLANVQHTLSFLANATGGQTNFNTNRFAPVFANLDRTTQSYYSLGYRPPHSGDDRRHEIEVRIKKGKGLKLRYRRTYRDKPSTERMADRTLGALLYGLESNPLAARLQHRPTQSADSEKTVVLPVEITIPLAKLVFAADDERPRGRLRLVMVARDLEGRITPIRQQRIDIRLSQEEMAQNTHHSFVVDIDMRPGEHVVAVGIRDEATQETSYLASRVDVRPATIDG